MLRRILLASALILTSATVFTSEAKAQTATPTDGTVQFSGVVDGGCIFSNPIPGTIVVNSGDQSLLGSDNSSGDYPGGTAAQIDVSCTTDATLSIAAPQRTGDIIPSTSTTFSASATSSNLNLDFDSNGGANSDAITTGQQDTINVNMLVTSPEPIAGGNYSYDVTLTATP